MTYANTYVTLIISYTFVLTYVNTYVNTNVTYYIYFTFVITYVHTYVKIKY